MPELTDLDTTDHRERDAASIRILGFFFTVLGLLVLAATLTMLGNGEETDSTPAETTSTEAVTEDSIAAADDSSTFTSTPSVRNKRGAIVNAVSGLVLTAVGAGMLWFSKRSATKP